MLRGREPHQGRLGAHQLSAMDGPRESTASEPHILWDVIAEHLDEAEFAYTSWASALESPLYTLSELASGPEEQLFAHVDGLVIGGSEVAERALAPELDAPDEPRFSRLVAAGLALLGQGRLDVVERALWSEEPLICHAAQHALVLGAPPQFDARLAAQLARPLGPKERTVLLGVAAGRGLSLPNLLASLESSDVEEARAAAVLVRWSDPRRHVPAIEHLVDHPDLQVRDAALVTALQLGSFPAWRRCVALASSVARVEPLAMLLMALLGGPAEHEILVNHLARPSHRHATLFALGFAGQAALGNTLLDVMSGDDPRGARLAGEAFSNLTGLDTSMDPYVEPEPPETGESLPPLEQDELEADLVPPVEDDLPLPNPQAILAWWQANAGRFDVRHRLLWGRPWTVETAYEVFEQAPLRRRHPMALWFAIRSSGRVQVHTRAFSGVQRAQIAPARGMSDQTLSRRFGG
jgi:uncharacterized protein (TIGR02270 family)